MKSFKQAEMESLYPNEDVSEKNPCEVRIDGTKIVVSYENAAGDGFHVWEGSEKGQGHFVLACPQIKGRATLHFAFNDEQLEGSWVQEGLKGMWLIDLNEPVD